MSGGYACRCWDHRDAMAAGKANYRKRFWRIVQFRCNHSAFNGYRLTHSAYSEIRCMVCGNFWRTKAAYVHQLKEATHEEKVRAVSCPQEKLVGGSHVPG